jgi:glutamine synthetase type III
MTVWGAQLVPSVKRTSGPSNRSMPGFMTTRPAFSARAKPSSTAIVTPSVRCRVNGPSAGRG